MLSERWLNSYSSASVLLIQLLGINESSILSYSIISWLDCHRQSWWVFFVVLEFELRASYMLGNCSTTWAMPPVLFWFSYFSCRILCFRLRLALDCNPLYLRLLRSWDHRHTIMSGLFVEMRVLLTFCPCWPQITMLLISAV
jgi:hypothetical protein